MAGWEEELAVLLDELGVKQEEPDNHLQATRKPTRSELKPIDTTTDDVYQWEHEDESEEDAWANDLEMMRREVDSIVNQVVLLMQKGELNSSLREDVMVVLRALRRRIPVSQHSSFSDEAYLESASAMLHFCRLVLQISEFSNDDF